MVHGACLDAIIATMLPFALAPDFYVRDPLDDPVARRWMEENDPGQVASESPLLLVSGRASFELTQKAWMAGIPVLAAVSAPSTLATDFATETGMTLVGFLRGPTMNVYAGAHRLG